MLEGNAKLLIVSPAMYETYDLSAYLSVHVALPGCCGGGCCQTNMCAVVSLCGFNSHYC